MRTRIVFLVTTLLSLLVLGCRHQVAPSAAHGSSHPPASEHAAHAERVKEDGASVPLLEGLGAHTHPITTSSPLAQTYFDHGLNLLYAFNPEEAKVAFEQSAKLDPKCAMAWWGIALSLGPNINVPRLPDQEKDAYTAVRKALALASGASEPERAYIEALAKRYAATPGDNGKVLDQDYADAMREVSRRYPEDLDAATLCAEALMDLRPWQLWTLDGKPQPGTPEIVATLESVLDRDPRHPGANHYYVHAMEASPHPEKALGAAERLGGLMPGAGHIVHMPFHIYARVGRYDDAAKANAQAVKVDRAYLERSRHGSLYAMMYYPHNIHSLCASLMMEGRRAESLSAARDLVRVVTPKMAREMQMTEFFTPALLFTLARFGEWDAILAEPKPPGDLRYLSGIWHYARGVALAAKGRIHEVPAEQDALALMIREIPASDMESLNTGSSLLKLAAAVLAGELAARRGWNAQAVPLFEDAVGQQDALNYDEPSPWYYPVRQALGTALLGAGRASDAEAVFRKDLDKNPENGWSLFGLRESLRAQGKKDDADAVDRRFRAAWARADVKLAAARF